MIVYSVLLYVEIFYVQIRSYRRNILLERDNDTK